MILLLLDYRCLNYNPVYLVVLFVGLLVVIGLGIALTFWCCRGSSDHHTVTSIYSNYHRLLSESVMLPMLSLRVLWWTR